MVVRALIRRWSLGKYATRGPETIPPAQMGTGTPDGTKFLKDNGVWSVPPGGGGTPASTVTSETTFGISAAVGTGTDYARNDHTHGSPSLGTSGTTACAGNDARLSDARTPLAHTHAAGDLPNLAGITAPNASVNFNGQQATSFRIENRTSDPGTPATGEIWLRTDL